MTDYTHKTNEHSLRPDKPRPSIFLSVSLWTPSAPHQPLQALPSLVYSTILLRPAFLLHAWPVLPLQTVPGIQ